MQNERMILKYLRDKNNTQDQGEIWIMHVLMCLDCHQV